MLQILIKFFKGVFLALSIIIALFLMYCVSILITYLCSFFIANVAILFIINLISFSCIVFGVVVAIDD